MTRVVSVDDSGSVDEVAAALAGGAVALVPTDTIYGLAVRADDPIGVARVFALKQRPSGLHLAVLVADADQAVALGAEIGDTGRRLIERFWPGALTIVVPGTGLPELGGADSTVGVRCPDADWIRQLAAKVGPLAVTSANLHGEPTPVSAEAALQSIPGIGVAVDGGTLSGSASTVVSVVDGLKVLRPGPVSAEQLAAALS